MSEKKAKVNIEMLNQSISEASIMIGVKQKDLNKAIKSLYQTFFEN
ncbi:ACT domain-containing protein [Brachyspira catarrhinii]